MAIGSGTAVNVPIKLEVLRSSIGELEKVLGGLKPDSKSFKDLQKIITDTRREMDRLQAQTSRPFGSQQQFNQAEKSVDKIDEALEQARLTISRIKFDELELSPEQLQQFQEFDDRIKQLAQNLIDFKNQMKAGLLEDVDFSNFLRSIDPQYAEKSFDEIIQMVETKTKEIADKLQKSERALSTYQRTAELGTRITQAQNKARNNKDLMKQANAIFGANKAEEFFTINKNGVFGAKSGKRNAFFEELKTQFSLTPQQLDELKTLSVSRIFEKIFTADENNPKNNFFAPQLKKAAEASNKMITEQSNRDELVQQSNRLQAANDKVRDSTNQVADAEQRTAEAINSETAAQEQNRQSLERAAQSQDNYGDSLTTSRTQLDSFRQILEQTNAAFLRNERQVATFNSIKSAITNFMGFNQVLNLTKRAINEAANHIKQLDTVMNGIAIVTDMTTADLWQQVDAYSRIAQNYGTSIQGAYEVSKIYYQAGYETAEVMTLTNETLKLSTISGLDYATTTDYMMTAMRGFKLEMEDASRVVDVYSNLAANTAVSQQELAEAMTRTASSMESVGATFEETSSMIATMVAVTRESASNIGSAMKSIAARYGELTKNPTGFEDLEGEAYSFNKVDEALQSVGISMKDADGQFRRFTDVILELTDRWDSLTSVQQRYIATQFAGNRQQSRFLALVSNGELLRENLQNAENSEDVGTLQALEYLDSLEAKINQVQVAYQQFYTTIGIEDAWKGVLGFVRQFIDSLNSLPKVFDKIPINAANAIYTVVSLAKNSLLGLLAQLASQFRTILEQMKVDGMRIGREIGEQTGKAANEGMSRQLASVSDTLKDTSKWKRNVEMIGQAFVTLGLAIDKSSEAGRVFSGVLTGLGGVAQIGSGIAQGWAGIPQIISGALNVINGFSLGIESTEEKIERLTKEAETLSNAAKQAKADERTLNNSIEKIKELEQKRYDSAESAEEYQAAVEELADSFPELISGLTSSGEALIDMESAEALLEEARRKTAQATYEAIDAERKTKKEQNKALEENIRSYSEFTKDDTELQDNFIEADSGKSVQQFYALQNAYKQLGGKEDDFSLSNFISNLASIEGPFQEILKDVLDKGYTEDLAAKVARQNINKIVDESELKQQYLDILDLYINPFEPADIDFVYDFFAGLKDEKLDSDEFLSRYNNFLSQIASLPQVIQEYIEEQFDISNLNQQIQELRVGYHTELALNKTSILYYINTIKNSYKDIFDNTNNIQYLADILDAAAEGQDIDEFLTSDKADKIINDYINNYNQLSEQQKEIWKNLDTTSMTATQMIRKLSDVTDAEGVPQEFENLINEYAINTVDNLKKIVKSFDGNTDFVYDINDTNLRSLARTAFNISKELDPAFTQLIINQGKQIKQLEKDGLYNFAKQYTEAAKSLDELIASDDTLYPLLESVDLTTHEGIAQAKQIISEHETEITDAKGINDALDKMDETIVDNALLTIRAVTDSIAGKAEDISGIFSKIDSGMSYKDASKLVDYVQTSLGNAEFNLADNFTTLGGKYYLISTTVNDVHTWLSDYLTKEANEADKAVTDFKERYGESWSIGMSVTDAMRQKLLEIAGSEENLSKYIGKENTLTKDGVDAFAKELEIIERDATNAGNVANTILTSAFQSYEWSHGNYSDVIPDDSDIREYLSGRRTYDETDMSAIKPAIEKAQSGLNILYSDLLAKGAENLNLADYSDIGIPQEILEKIKKQGLSSAEQFLNDYGQYLGKSAEELADMYIKAIESEESAAKAISGIGVSSRGSRINFTAVTAKLGAQLTSGLGELLEHYGATLKDGILTIQNDADIASIITIMQAYANEAGINLTTEMATLADTTIEVIRGYTSLIQKGMSGKLTNVEAEQVQGFAQRNGFDVTFTRTADGLKIANDEALKLIQALRSMDSLQANLAFEDYAKNIAATNQEYSNISRTMAEIARLKEEIAKADEEEKKQLEQQLALARKIAYTMTADASQFSFMDRALPGGMNNPINYWNAWGKAFTAMNKAKSSGYMDIADFYNLVNEMTTMAMQTGQSMTFMGQTIAADGSGAAELIQAGLSALTNVDGKGVQISMKALGTSFNIGADEMYAGIEDGIHTFAESQIEMLDAEIALLEVVVAMEDLELGENGILDFTDLFEESGDGAYKATGQFNNLAKSILNLDDEGVQNALKNFTVNINGVDVSLTDIFTDIMNGKDIDDIAAKAVADLLIHLQEAIANGDWDGTEQGLQNIIAQALETMQLESEWNLQMGVTGPSDQELQNVADEAARKAEEVAKATRKTPPTKGKFKEATPDEEVTESSDNERKFNIETILENVPEGIRELIESVGEPIQRFIELVISASGDTEALDSNDSSSKRKIVISGHRPQQVAFDNKEEENPHEDIPRYIPYSQLPGAQYAHLNSPGTGLDSEIVIETDNVDLNSSDNDNLEIANPSEPKIRLTSDNQPTYYADDFINTAHDIIPEDIDVEYVANTWWNQIVAAFNAWTKSKQASEEQHITEGPEGPTPSYGDIPDADEFSKNMGEGADSAQEAEKATEGIAQATENTTQAVIDTNKVYEFYRQLVDQALESRLSENNAIITQEDAQDDLNAAVATTAAQWGLTEEEVRKIIQEMETLSTTIKEMPSFKFGVNFNGTQGGYLSGQNQAKGTFGGNALASGRRTLMGELGPELYVTNGHYYVAGQSGAEFVDLPDDAIVFNHLQTKRLLSTGRTSHGSPITNERNAISYATGNVTGPAMADASTTLATLKQIRAMWQAMLEASAKDLGQLAGGGGGGGGKDAADNAGYIHDLEIWYNLLRKIAKLEKDITYEEALQSKIQSDRIKNGRALYSSYKRELDRLDESIESNTKLVNLQRDFYLKSIEETNNSVFGKIFTFTDEGLMQYNSDLTDYINDLTKTNSTYFENGKIHIKGTSYVRDDEGNVIENKKGQAQVETFDKVLDTAKSGLDFLAQLQATDENGGAIYTAEEQLEILKAYGFGDIVQYDSSGKKLDTSDQNYATNAVKAFFDRFDGIIEENDSLFDSILDTEKQILSQTTQRNEILQKIVDNQIDVENQVLEAIENREQAIIDELQKERDAMKEASDAYIDGLNKQLNNERQMYQNQQDETELSRLRRQLAILQRSGGSAAQISSLQQDISNREQDAYFEAQQQQIDAIKEASDLEIERLDAQLDLMKETLEYEKQNGLLWPEVTKIMKETPEEITNFIKTYTPSYRSDSELQNTEALNDIREKVELWVSNRDDKKNPLDSDTTGWNNSFKALEDQYGSYNDIWTEANQAKAKKAYDKEYAQSADPVKANEAAKAVFAQLLSDYKKKNGNGGANGSDTSTNSTGSGTGNGSGSAGKGMMGSGTGTVEFQYHVPGREVQKKYLYPQAGTVIESNKYILNFTGYTLAYASPASVTVKEGKIAIIKYVYKLNKVGGSSHSGGGANKFDAIAMDMGGFSAGGLNDYTGLAMLHGTKTKPEAVLNAEETRTLREDIMSGKSNSLMSLLLDFRDTMSETAGFKEYANLNNSNESVSIGAINLTMQATISNDYDARQAADSAYERILEIARKTGTQGIRR